MNKVGERFITTEQEWNMFLERFRCRPEKVVTSHLKKVPKLPGLAVAIAKEGTIYLYFTQALLFGKVEAEGQKGK